MTRDSRKRTPMGGPFMRERRGSGPEKQQPKDNPCRPVGRNWKSKLTTWSLWRETTGTWTPGIWLGKLDRLESKGYPNTINGKCEVVQFITSLDRKTCVLPTADRNSADVVDRLLMHLRIKGNGRKVEAIKNWQHKKSCNFYFWVHNYKPNFDIKKLNHCSIRISLAIVTFLWKAEH